MKNLKKMALATIVLAALSASAHAGGGKVKPPEAEQSRFVVFVIDYFDGWFK